MPQDTNAKTARAATLENTLPLDSLRLLGISTGPSGAKALLRAPNGDIFWAETHSKTDYGHVLAISSDKVVLRDGTSTRTLALLS